ncbi:30S ribosomal protein S28e [ANME-1 cluster archaeon ex4572_4]|nr:30S ribosomal protein S28e [Methanophagales archaeon]OYT67588.1 MAG: 30S ribosomal protein S28e [ANME-1 cluster archaeon ex4572_4]PXF51418.1 MAG: 30S ribosomal protein S28e [Methanophagales archaeon]
MSEERGTPAEVVEIVGRTGMHGESTQIKCKLLAGQNRGRVITRNCRGPVKTGDVIVLLETAREVRKLMRRR